ncbi:MAG: response regulator transcription factor [Melioribacteraceae bacterium]|nr:response regulator transcription factor [Melioribacteraceae bacterium]MCF8354920.1 response regulator transcription factor [Melioribacteraceae bacterium]MCF8395245.1 response regulator transcription factor [Melioribacteraceae bacterium]MCF8420709.1 response regulator transcription factor [Melioribacteraceae bacterium]
MKVLIAEDEITIARSLKKSFNEEKIDAEIAADGNSALQMINETKYDFLILDWKMPYKNGYEVCKELRSTGNYIPIILLTALSDIQNKIAALDIGADDYITKPFSFTEVLARIKAIQRRNAIKTKYLYYKNIRINLIDHKLVIENNEIDLTEKEFDLLRYFFENKGRILSKEELCSKVWNYNFIPGSNIVESSVKNLRKKIEECCNQKVIKNVYGEGYILID